MDLDALINDAEAEKELRMQERLYQAKQKRIEKSQAGKRHGVGKLFYRS